MKSSLFAAWSPAVDSFLKLTLTTPSKTVPARTLGSSRAAVVFDTIGLTNLFFFCQGNKVKTILHWCWCVALIERLPVLLTPSSSVSFHRSKTCTLSEGLVTLPAH